MKNNYSFNSIKQYLKTQNVVFYGTIRDIENDFLSSFLNLELLANLFNKAFFIILENDSADNTRQLLINWSKTNASNKKVILKNNLNEYFPLRATRLAYCRNEILNFMKANNLQETYNYAIHCDLDNRFWCINPECIFTCFTSDDLKWDMMSAVSKNRTYYDFWALRCEQSWFNINIFSCDNFGINYETKIEGFEKILKNTEDFIPVNSSFNGMAIYKMHSLLQSSYNANYNCFHCNNLERGCWEDNDHIGLHKQLIHKGCKLFINNKMEIISREESYTPYHKFIESFELITDLKKNILTWLCYSDMIDYTKDALCIGEDINLEINSIAKYYYDNQSSCKVYYSSKFPNYILNKNVERIEDNVEHHKQLIIPNKFSLLYLNIADYVSLKIYLEYIKSNITKGTILIFNNFINKENYYIHGFKAFYEFSQIYKLQFECLGNNSFFNEQSCVALKVIEIDDFHDITQTINFYDSDYIDFDWIKYTNFYSDLQHVSTKESAYIHWLLFGKSEGRTLFKKNIITFNKPEELLKNTTTQMEEKLEDDFYWEMYIDLNDDLKDAGLMNEEDAIRHWINHGRSENRKYKFNWCKYIEQNNLLSFQIDTKDKAIAHWKTHGYTEVIEYEVSENLFDWKYYTSYNDDLKHINNYKDAKFHWDNFGKKEGRKGHNFNWMEYIILNPELAEQGIDTEIKAVTHWLKQNAMP